MMGFAYCAAAWRMVMMPSRGNKMSGIKAVTAMGTAFVTHHVIIQAPAAITLLAPGEIRVSGSAIQSMTNKRGPRTNPTAGPGRAKFTSVRVAFGQNYFF